MKVIIEAHNVEKGMYVSELDKPWLETPFLFQGFRVTNQDEIEQIRNLCDFVFVDTEKSTVPVTPARNEITVDPDKAETPNFKRIIRDPLPYSENFEQEFVYARDCHQRAAERLDSLFTDIRMGKSLDVAGVRETVTSMMGSILRNPDALVLLASLDSKDQSMVNHALSVCVLSLAFGRSLGFDNETLLNLGLGALLHDIGEIKIPDRVLANAVNASEEERSLLEGHAMIGAMMLNKLDSLPDNVISIVRDHHERADGSGYPNHLTSSQIDFNTKIVSIVDAYDSIISGKQEYEGISIDNALKNIYAWRRDLFDELLVEKFIQCVGIYPLGSVVELRTGQVGIVISSRPDARLFPTIMLVLDAHKDPVEPPRMVNLTLFKEKLDSSDFEVKGLVNGEEFGIDVRRYILREMSLA